MPQSKWKWMGYERAAGKGKLLASENAQGVRKDIHAVHML